MSPVHRSCAPGPIKIDVRLLDAIEGVTASDDAPRPDVIAPLMARVDAERDAYRDPEVNDELVADTLSALNGCWLSLWEIYCIQRLRGWHRSRRGRITVDAYWLAATRNVLDSLTLSLGSECDTALDEFDYAGDHDLRAEVTKSLIRDGTCGECTWCVCLRLRDECDAVLDAAGFDGGSRYRAYCLDESPEQLAERYRYRDYREASAA